MKKLSTLGLKASTILLSTAVLVACNNKQSPGTEYAPDMYHSIPLDPYKQIKANDYNLGGMNMREPAKGTVVRGKQGYNLYLSVDTAEVAGVELKNPLPYTQENLVQGQVLYSRFCSPCHGEEGDGQGLVGQKFKGVPSYSAGRVAELPGGHIYHVITNGRGRMRPHGSLVNPTERWKIVMYVQQLQKGETGTDVAGGDAAGAGATTGDGLRDEAGGEAITDNPVTGTPANTTPGN